MSGKECQGTRKKRSGPDGGALPASCNFYPKGSNKRSPSKGLTQRPGLHFGVAVGCVETELGSGDDHIRVYF